MSYLLCNLQLKSILQFMTNTIPMCLELGSPVSCIVTPNACCSRIHLLHAKICGFPISNIITSLNPVSRNPGSYPHSERVSQTRGTGTSLQHQHQQKCRTHGLLQQTQVCCISRFLTGISIFLISLWTGNPASELGSHVADVMIDHVEENTFKL